VPGTPDEFSGADNSTPCSSLGVAVVDWSMSVVTAWYTTYTADPSGAMAGAEYADRSAASEIAVGVDQLFPPFVEYENSVFSWFSPSAPSLQASTISFVASAPVGAPFAMSMLGIAARSVRAPATPSYTHRPSIFSTNQQASFMGRTSRGLPHV
jgi:hypothetical protein